MYPNASTGARNNLPSPLLTATPSARTDAGQADNFGQALESSLKQNNRVSTQGEGARKPDNTSNNTRQSGESQQADKSSQNNQDNKADKVSENSTSNSEQSNTARGNEGTDQEVDKTANASATPAEDAVEAAKLAVATVLITTNNSPAAQMIETEEGEAETPQNRPTGSSILSTNEPSRGLKNLITSEGQTPGQGLASVAAPDTLTSTINAKKSALSATVASSQAFQAIAQDPKLILQQASSALGSQDQSPITLQNFATPFALTSSRADGTGITTMQISTQAGQRAWADDVANRVMWLAGRGDGRAELVLTPPNLGKLGVSIQMNGDQATAHFVTASNAAREVLEQAMPRLREALLQAGIAMSDSSVSTSSQHQSRDDKGDGQSNSSQRSDNGEYGMLSGENTEASSPRFVQVGNGLVDIFA